MASTEQKKRWAGNVLLESSNQTFPHELVLAVGNMLLLVVQHAKNGLMLTRVKKANDMNIIVPIVCRVQVGTLTATAESASTEVIVKQTPTLLRMGMNQNLVLHVRWMVREIKIKSAS